MKMELEIELMEWWIEEVRGFDDMWASHNDLLYVQKRMVIKGCLTLMNFQLKGDSWQIFPYRKSW